MQTYYYINDDGNKDGPHDLVSIMRRIRAGKINRHTMIYSGDHERPMAAGEIPDIFLLFENVTSVEQSNSEQFLPTFQRLVTSGWRFVAEHSIVTAFSGCILLLILVSYLNLAPVIGYAAIPLCLWWFLLLQSIFIATILRLHRSQPISEEFWDQKMLPLLPKLVLYSLTVSIAACAGFIALLVPGILVWVWFSFVPLLFSDQPNLSATQAIKNSKLLLKTHSATHFHPLVLLTLAYLLSLVLIIPLPLTLPIYAAALCDLYEDLSDV